MRAAKCAIGGTACEATLQGQHGRRMPLRVAMEPEGASIRTPPQDNLYSIPACESDTIMEATMTTIMKVSRQVVLKTSVGTTHHDERPTTNTVAPSHVEPPRVPANAPISALTPRALVAECKRCAARYETPPQIENWRTNLRKATAHNQTQILRILSVSWQAPPIDFDVTPTTQHA